MTVVCFKVNHSQRSNETPLKTWVIAKEDGEVIAAHCNCMAGLVACSPLSLGSNPGSQPSVAYPKSPLHIDAVLP